MELSKKTTILFPPSFHEHLVRVAAREGVSLGELVRKACGELYGPAGGEHRFEAATRIRLLSLPVGSVAGMKAESVPPPKRLRR
jgi:hypothetical protein